ncbi:MAG TPA: class I SAM-dependent methyltransferase [Pyrinomonadaceae bacterium]
MALPSKQSLPDSVIRAIRSGRRVAYLSLTPFDYLWRALNGKSDLPPLHLRRHVGPLRSFETSGAEFMAYLQLLCKLQPHERVLDIGCGCGQMALHLLSYLDERGAYAGADIHSPSINWCRRHIGRHHANFEFQYLDVKSDAYNPHGRHKAENLRFTFADQEFDVILLKSVFTHMRPVAVENYLSEVARLLSKNGRSLATFFLLNERQGELAQKGRNQLQFDYGDEIWRYVYQNSPESAVAYEEGFIMGLLDKYGLKLKEPIMYGRWSGRADGLSYQDMLLLEKQ